MPKPGLKIPGKDRTKTKGGSKPKKATRCPACGEHFDSHGVGGNCLPRRWRGRTARLAKLMRGKPAGPAKSWPTTTTDYRDKTLASLASKGGGIRLV